MKRENYQNEDRRIFERIAISITVRLLDKDANKELEAFACDVSTKGVGIVSQEFLRPYDALELWLKIPDKKEPLYTRGAVVWIESQKTGKYRLGVSLDRAELMGISRIFRT